MLMSAGIDRFCTSTHAGALAFGSSGQHDVFYAVPLDFRKMSYAGASFGRTSISGKQYSDLETYK